MQIEAGRPCSREEAIVLTNHIRTAATHLYTLLLEAHERRAWEALGYSSWREYAKTEFDMGQSHAYRLLDQGRVIRALEQVTHSPMGEIISERVARDLRPQLALVASEVQDRVQRGEDPNVAVRDVITAVRDLDRPTPRQLAPDEAYLRSRKRVDRPNRWIANLVFDLVILTENLPTEDTDLREARETAGLDLSQVDRACIPEWVRCLRGAEKQITAFAAPLEQQAGDT